MGIKSIFTKLAATLFIIGLTACNNDKSYEMKGPGDPAEPLETTVKLDSVYNRGPGHAIVYNAIIPLDESKPIEVGKNSCFASDYANRAVRNRAGVFGDQNLYPNEGLNYTVVRTGLSYESGAARNRKDRENFERAIERHQRNLKKIGQDTIRMKKLPVRTGYTLNDARENKTWNLQCIEEYEKRIKDLKTNGREKGFYVCPFFEILDSSKGKARGHFRSACEGFEETNNPVYADLSEEYIEYDPKNRCLRSIMQVLGPK